jgi:hypothetical protein
VETVVYFPHKGSICVKTTALNQRVDIDKLTFWDIVLVVVIVVLSTAIILKVKLGLNWQSPGVAHASIYQSGKLNKLLELDKDQQIILLDGKMTVEIKGKKIRVKKSDCPRQVCVRIGWIAYPGEAITCVPFKTVIEIGSAKNTVLDAVVF